MWRPFSPRRTSGIPRLDLYQTWSAKTLENVVGWWTIPTGQGIALWIINSSLMRCHQKSTGKIMVKLAPKYNVKESLAENNRTIESLRTFYLLGLWMKIQCNKWKSSTGQEESSRSMFCRKEKFISDSVFDLWCVPWVSSTVEVQRNSFIP